ncbi:Nop14-like protein [Amylostereum chailletii]|nr:Nop14-like protein [Amylostereum chailletii]
MAKGSQLTQLKSALSTAGITKPQQSSKKRKRAQTEEKDRTKRTEKLNEIHQKLNPFDVKVTKLKHDVGGRKLKGVTGRPAQSRQAGIDQRKKTLLKEFEDKGRVGGLVDRRFGENDPTMTPEERMLERFTREKQRASKGAAFNLEEEDELTHYGQSISKFDDFDNSGLVLDDEDDPKGQIDGSTVQRAHFGGFDDDEEDEDHLERTKTKAEVMAEVIAKSKEHKLQRQMEREQNDNIRHELDQELDSIRSLLMQPDPLTSGLERSNGISTLPAAEKDQEYDQFIRELVFDKRARPKDRTKTEEEVVLEEKHRLEKAERARLRRMNGEDDMDSSDEERPRKRKKLQGGDDLEDDFLPEDGAWSGLGHGLQEDDSTEGEDTGVSDDENGITVGSEGNNLRESFDSDDEREKPVKKPSKPSGLKELPFTFPCPSSHQEFLEIIHSVHDQDVPTVIQRIRTLHHPSLGVENKYKLQALSGVLVDHILHITAPPNPRFSLLSSLIPHIYALTKMYPIQSADHFVEKLVLMNKNLKRGLGQGANNPGARTWPGLPELALLRTIGVVWPTSDMNHPVVSPTRLLMGSYLGLCRVRSLSDIACGLFLCTLLLQYEELSKRFVPEAINFLVNAVLHLAPHDFDSAQSLSGSFPSPDFAANDLTLEVNTAKQLMVNPPKLADILTNGAVAPTQSKVDMLDLTFDLLRRFAEHYTALEASVELLSPVLSILGNVKASRLCESLEKRLLKTVDSLNRTVKFAKQARRPLLLQAHKPIPIPSYIPKFESSSSSYLRAQDPDHERNEAAKLRKQVKQEKKGAIRELRKDARFLAGVEQEKQREKDRAYNASMKRVFGSIEGERAEEKAMERDKAREKRRAGRK